VSLGHSNWAFTAATMGRAKYLLQKHVGPYIRPRIVIPVIGILALAAMAFVPASPLHHYLIQTVDTVAAVPTPSPDPTPRTVASPCNQQICGAPYPTATPVASPFDPSGIPPAGTVITGGIGGGVAPPGAPPIPPDTSVWIMQGQYTGVAPYSVTIIAHLQRGFPGAPTTFVWGGALAGQTGTPYDLTGTSMVGQPAEAVTFTFTSVGTFPISVTATQVYMGLLYTYNSAYGGFSKVIVTAPVPASPTPVVSPSPSPVTIYAPSPSPALAPSPSPDPTPTAAPAPSPDQTPAPSPTPVPSPS
jgi:hypothetical protein